jgi:phosphoglycolate phosphatase
MTDRPRRFDLVVFDWDGTLFDSTALIVHSIQAACRDLGLPVPDDERASWVIGLSLHAAMEARGARPCRPEQLPQMVERYRRPLPRAPA